MGCVLVGGGAVGDHIPTNRCVGELASARAFKSIGVAAFAFETRIKVNGEAVGGQLAGVVVSQSDCHWLASSRAERARERTSDRNARKGELDLGS